MAAAAAAVVQFAMEAETPMHFNLSRFVEIVDRVGPAVLAVMPGGDKIAPIVPKIVHGIKEAQAMKGASGAEKKAHVLAAIADGAAVANATGKVKISGDELQAIAGKGIDTVIEAVHVVEGAKVAREGEPGSSASAKATIPSSGNPASTATPGDLGGGHAIHGHGSADDAPPAPPASTDDLSNG